MKKIGLIGGTGPESTLVYYKELNTRLNKAGNHSWLYRTSFGSEQGKLPCGLS